MVLRFQQLFESQRYQLLRWNMRFYDSNSREDLDSNMEWHFLLDFGPSLAIVVDTIKRQASHSNDLRVYPHQSVDSDHTAIHGL